MTDTHAVDGDDALVVGGHTFRSRLIAGTGKYRTSDEMVRALDASGVDCVTVAVRRVSMSDSADPVLAHHNLDGSGDQLCRRQQWHFRRNCGY